MAGRADARRNRENLLQAAATAFATADGPVSLEAGKIPRIAQHSTRHEFEQGFGVPALPIHRIEKRPWHVIIAVEGIADGRQTALRSVLFYHGEHHAATITIGIRAVVLKQCVAPHGQSALLDEQVQDPQLLESQLSVNDVERNQMHWALLLIARSALFCG